MAKRVQESHLDWLRENEPLVLEDVPSIGTEVGVGFWDGVDENGQDAGGFGEVTTQKYPQPEVDLRAVMRECGFTGRTAAERLGISVIDFFRLSTGRKRPVCGMAEVVMRLSGISPE